MKSPAGYAPPRRLAGKKKQVRLHLRRRSAPAPEEEIDTQPKSHFWLWVGLVALLHVVVIGAVAWFYWSTPAPTPPEPFISLLPEGALVKGSAGTQQAPKVGASTPAPSLTHPAPPPEPVPVPQPAQPPPKPVVKMETPPIVPVTPVAPPKPAPVKPTVKPTVKVDLTLADGPATEKPVKPKPHPKKPTTKPATETAATSNPTPPSSPDSSGLSKEQIAKQLGEKLQAAGVANATKTGISGSENTKANPFSDFYASIHDQVMSKWQSPNLVDDTAVNPLVQIHVEKDGRVPPEQVTLLRSSGNQTYDDSALTAAKSLGYLLEPLPDGCPPDISITFKLTR